MFFKQLISLLPHILRNFLKSKIYLALENTTFSLRQLLVDFSFQKQFHFYFYNTYRALLLRWNACLFFEFKDHDFTLYVCASCKPIEFWTQVARILHSALNKENIRQQMYRSNCFWNNFFFSQREFFFWIYSAVWRLMGNKYSF